jgi:hypothetical protein
MSQTRKGSAVEVAANLAVGYCVNFLANIAILPLFGFKTLTIAKNLEIGVVFTLVSVARQYVLRRWFNGLKFGQKEIANDASAK